MSSNTIEPFADNGNLPFWKSAINAWVRFFFKPTDPTIHGFIRIGAAVMSLYFLLAYAMDFSAFIDPHGWLDLKTRKKMVREEPFQVPTLNWPQQKLIPPATTEFERTYVLKYIRKWNEPPPLPHPSNAKEAREIDEYRDQWMVDPRSPLAKGANAFEKAFVRYYVKEFSEPPPLPHPKDNKEAQWIMEYRHYWQVDPRNALAIGTTYFSIWFHVTDPATMLALHWIFVGITFLYVIGFGSRVTSVMSWFIAISYIHRSPPNLFGVDTMLILCLMYLMIAPSGAALSVDSLISRWWRRRKARLGLLLTGDNGTMEASDEPHRPAPSVTGNFALRLLQINLCFIYGVAGLAKLKGNSWWSGEAVWGTLANYEFAPMQSSIYMYALELLCRNQFILQTFLILGTYFTLFFEITYPFLIWNRYTRWLILSMALVLHGLIGILMGLGTFAIIMLVFNLVFLPAPIVQWLKGWTNRADPMRWLNRTEGSEAKKRVSVGAAAESGQVLEDSTNIKELDGDQRKGPRDRIKRKN